MKILIISNYFKPEKGAAPYRIYQMAKGLSMNKTSVEVVCPFPNYPTGKIQGNYSGLYKKEINDNIIIHRLFIYPDNSKNKIKRAFSMLSFAISLWLIIKKVELSKVDKVIIQNSPLLVSFSSIILFKFFIRKEIILNISDLWPQSAIDLGFIKENSLSHKIFSKIEKFNYHYSDKFLGQSQEIIEYLNFTGKPKFLYRNIPNSLHKNANNKRDGKFDRSGIRIIYAGLLGVAQGLFNLIPHIENMKINVTLDIYGDGPEKVKLLEYLEENKSQSIRYMGTLTKEEVTSMYKKYHYALVPLVTNIKGAFPSKIYEIISSYLPIIYIGHGEAYKFIVDNLLGVALFSEEISLLEKKMISVTPEIYNNMVSNCSVITENEINFNEQMKELKDFIIEK